MGLAAKLDVSDSSIQAATAVFERLLQRYGKRDFDVRFWDGSTWAADAPRFTFVFPHPGSVRAMFEAPSELSLGEAYVRGDFDIEGDMEAAIAFGHFLLHDDRSPVDTLRLATMLHALPPPPHTALGHTGPHLLGWRHSKHRDRQAIQYHYDIPADFYELWLDRRMVYSCAYFRTPQDDLETAQENKLDHICRKLRLKTGEKLLDIGCGWGGLLIHAARWYGVRAMGITLSKSQAAIARERIADSALADRCHVELCDYRDVAGEQFDKIVSVGMFEHVGRSHFADYFAKARRLLKPGGVFLNHAIAYSATYVRKGPSFIDAYVFPDGDLVPLNVTLQAAEQAGFEVRDVESLREHYVLTLRHWVKRLEAQAGKARQITNDATYRIWRLYMAGSALAFRMGRLSVFQTLLSRPEHGDSGLPLTREDWYSTQGQ
jgi:cyclopropane-fatty-acyl-phospholipid synthase